MTEKMDVSKVAQLARLSISGQEHSKLGKDLNRILAYVEQLGELETAGVEPTSHVLPMKNVFRKDEVRHSDVRDRVLAHAPDAQGRYFKVPKVIE